MLNALQDRVAHGLFGYTAPSARLNQNIADYMARRHDWDVEPGWIVWLNGLVPALNLFCAMTGNPGDGVLVPTPVYPPFLAAPTNAGRDLLSVPLLQPSEDSDSGETSCWRIDWEQLEETVASFNTRGGSCSDHLGGPRVAALLLCSPHNPTGHVFEKPELEKLGEFCERHDILLCSDEIHADLLLEPGAAHVPAGAVSEALAERTVTLFAAVSAAKPFFTLQPFHFSELL